MGLLALLRCCLQELRLLKVSRLLLLLLLQPLLQSLLLLLQLM
jgi:hypothetical protein